jgi:hypothetical protein
MAINQETLVKQKLVEVVTAVNKICQGLDELEAINETLTQQNPAVDLTDFETAISSYVGIGHCDPATYQNILTYFAPQIVTALKAYYSGDPTQQAWAAFMKARLD